MKKSLLISLIILVILVFPLKKLFEYQELKSDLVKEEASELLLRIESYESFYLQEVEDLNDLLINTSMINDQTKEIVNSNDYSFLKDKYKSQIFNYIITNTKNKSTEEILNKRKPINELSFLDFLIHDYPIAIDSIPWSNSKCFMESKFNLFSFFPDQKFIQCDMGLRDSIKAAFNKALLVNNCRSSNEIIKGEIPKMLTVFRIDLQDLANKKVEVICTQCNSNAELTPITDSLSKYIRSINHPELDKMDSMYLKTWCIRKLESVL